MKFGVLPLGANADQPTAEERAAVCEEVAVYYKHRRPIGGHMPFPMALLPTVAYDPRVAFVDDTGIGARDNGKRTFSSPRLMTDRKPSLFEFCATHPGRDVTLLRGAANTLLAGNTARYCTSSFFRRCHRPCPWTDRRRNASRRGPPEARLCLLLTEYVHCRRMQMVRQTS